MGRLRPAAYLPGLKGLVRFFTSSGVMTAMTLGFLSASEGSTELIFAWAWGLRRIIAWSMPGRRKSSV